MYFTRTPNGLKSTKPVVLASVTPRNNTTSRDPASDSTTNSENPDKSQKSKIKNNREKEPENTVSMGQEPSSQIGNEAGDLRSKKNESPATDAKIEMQSARGNKPKTSDDLNEVCFLETYSQQTFPNIDAEGVTGANTCLFLRR